MLSCRSRSNTHRRRPVGRRRTLSLAQGIAAARGGFRRRIESELNVATPDAHGLTVLPFWAGERSTGWNPDAYGAILGLNLCKRLPNRNPARGNGSDSLSLRTDCAQPLNLLRRAQLLIASGHALRSSPTWVQILADVLGRRVLVSELSEASMRGAALLALEAAGKIRNYRRVFNAGRNCVRAKHRAPGCVPGKVWNARSESTKSYSLKTVTPQSGW